MTTDLLEQEVSAITEYNPVAAGLAELKRKYANVAVDVSTFKALEEAKRVRAEIREPRYETEKIRKALKAPALAHAKLIDTEAARITAELLAIEGPWDEAIKAEEFRKEEERKAREAAERKRVTDIHANIAAITSYVVLAGECRTAAKVQALIDKVRAVEISKEVFQEFEPEAAVAKAEALQRMGAIHQAKADEEAERARVAAEQEATRVRLAEERAELDRQRAAQAQADKEAADKRAAEAKQLADERAALEQQRADLERKLAQAAAATVPAVSTLVEPAIVTGPASTFEQDVQAMAEAIGAPGTTNMPAWVDTSNDLSFTPNNAEWDTAPFPPTDREIINSVADRFDVDTPTAIEWIKAIDFTTL